MTSERFPLDPILVSILKTKERDGSTLNEIRGEFFVGTVFILYNCAVIIHFLEKFGILAFLR